MKTKPKKDLKCTVCDKSFQYQYMLNLHTAVHTKEQKYKCDKCPNTYKYPISLKNHQKITHDSNAEDTHCNICDKLFISKSNLKTHIEAVHEGKRSYDCKMCGESFKSFNAYNNHKIKIHAKDKREFECGCCNKRFNYKGHMRRHVAYVHTDEKKYKCDVCPKEYKFKHSLDTHVKTDHSDNKEIFKCGICFKDLSSKHLLKAHELTQHQNNTIYKCDACPKMYKHPDSLRKHKRTHIATVKNEWRCVLCLKVFSTNSSLKRHKTTHKQIAPHTCNICNKTFKWSQSLKTHQIKEHDVKILTTDGVAPAKQQFNRRRNIKCNICEKVLTNTTSYKSHMNSHAGVKRYKCSVCLQGFTERRVLNAHKIRLKHGSVETKKVLECERCDSTFAEEWTLQKHIKFIHTGQKPYKCEECGDAFERAKELNCHMAKNKCVKCIVCGLRFRLNVSLRIHMKKVH